jgi:hypothetical protein
LTCYIRGELVKRYIKIMDYSQRAKNIHGDKSSIRKKTVLRNINKFKREGDLERAEKLEALLDEFYGN